MWKKVISYNGYVYIKIIYTYNNWQTLFIFECEFDLSGGLGGVKEEDILSDSEGGHTTTLDPSSPVVTSKLILNG